MDLRLIKYIDRYAGIPLCYLLKAKEIFSSKRVNNIRKVLIIKFSGFGNIVLAIPGIRAIRRRYPNAEIVFLTHTMNKSLVEKDPAINRIITFDVEGGKETAKEMIKLIRKLRKERFDIIFDLEQFSRFSSIISSLSNARIIIGFDTPKQGRGLVYDIKVKYKDKHTSKLFADLLSSTGADIDFKESKIAITKDDKKNIDEFLRKNKIKKKDILVGMHPGCGLNNPRRKWSGENFAKLADFLIEEYKARVFFTGSNSEKTLVKEIQAMMKNKSVDSSGEFNLRELSEIISRSRVFFSSDTGPLHICSAMQTPVVAFFGPNTPKIYGPIGDRNIVFYKNMKCSPCTTNLNEKSTNCKHFNCINKISFEEVRERIKNSDFFKK